VSPERKRDVDYDVQRIVDDVTARRAHLTTGQVRTALATGLASVGVHLAHDVLQSWATAIADGERIRAENDYR
jgi:hypothetical protein